MNTQPEALQMSDVIDFLNRLRQSEKEAWRYADELEQERKLLHEVNQMLVKAAEGALGALEMYCKHGEILWPLETKEALRKALAKAKEQA